MTRVTDGAERRGLASWPVRSPAIGYAAGVERAFTADFYEGVRPSLKLVGPVGGSFLGLVALIAYLETRGALTMSEAGLMVVALFGMYVGFGILIAVYRLISKLD